MHWRPIQRTVPQPRGRCRRRSLLTAASATNIESEVKSINRTGAVDPTDDVELPVKMTDAIVKAAEFWAGVRRSRIPTSSTDALDAESSLQAKRRWPASQGDTAIIATTNLARSNRFPGGDAQTWDQIRQAF